MGDPDLIQPQSQMRGPCINEGPRVLGCWASAEPTNAPVPAPRRPAHQPCPGRPVGWVGEEGAGLQLPLLRGRRLGGVKHLLAAFHPRHSLHVLPPVAHLHRPLLGQDTHTSGAPRALATLGLPGARRPRGLGACLLPKDPGPVSRPGQTLSSSRPPLRGSRPPAEAAVLPGGPGSPPSPAPGSDAASSVAVGAERGPDAAPRLARACDLLVRPLATRPRPPVPLRRHHWSPGGF